MYERAHIIRYFPHHAISAQKGAMEKLQDARDAEWEGMQEVLL